MKRLVTYKSLVGRLLMTLLLPATMLLQSCGDDEGQFNGALDNTLRVVTILPQNGEFGVDTTAQLQIRMNMPLSTSTVNGKVKVSVSNTGAEIQLATSFTEGDTVIIASPTGVNGQWPGNTQFKVELLQGIQAINGVTLQSPFTSFFSTGQGSGFGSTSKPGIAPTVSSFTPGGNYLSPGQYGTSAPAFIVRFSECVPANSLAANVQIQTKDWPLHLSPGEMLATVQPDAYDDRKLYIFMVGFLDNMTEVKVKILSGLEDCNGDQLVSTYTKDYFTFNL